MSDVEGLLQSASSLATQSPLFGRAYKLSFSQNNPTGINTALLTGTYIEQFKDVGFRIVFEVTKSNTSSSNTGKIAIYNPPIDIINLASEEDVLVELEVGYNNLQGTGLILFGSIEKTDYIDEGADKVLEILVNETSSKYQAININLPVPAGTTLYDLFAYLTNYLQAFNPTIKSVYINYVAEPFALPSPITLDGNCWNILEDLLRQTGHSVFLTNGTLYISPTTDNPLSVVTRLVAISDRSGLIGKPELATEKDTDKKLITAVKLRSLMNKNLDVGVRVTLDSNFLPSIFMGTVENLTFKGDSFQGDWLVEVSLSKAKDPSDRRMKNIQNLRY